MTTFQDFLDDAAAKGKETNMDFAWAALRGPEETLIEVKVIWITAGGFPKEFPPTSTSTAHCRWDERWTIVRCAEQPKPQVINLRTGQFLKHGMPDIKIER